MFTYGDDSIQINETIADFEEIGDVTIDKFGKYLPFYAPTNTYTPLYLNDTKFCKGNCFEHFEKHLSFKW
jgi:hypothetical protein